MSLQAQIKSARKSAGFSQDAVAAAMAEKGFAWHQATVYKVETGRRQLLANETSALADVLGVESDLLFSGKRTLETSQEVAFRETVRDRRTARKLRQVDVADAMSELGTTTDATTITRIEKGQVRPSLHQAVLLAQILEFTFDLNGTQDPSSEERERRLAALEGALANIARECQEARSS